MITTGPAKGIFMAAVLSGPITKLMANANASKETDVLKHQKGIDKTMKEPYACVPPTIATTACRRLWDGLLASSNC